MENGYPFLAEAAIFEVPGHVLPTLYFSLRQYYDQGKGLHSPQLGYDFEEFNGELMQKSVSGGLEPLDLAKTYHMVIDGWLTEHLYDEGYRIDEWVSVLQNSRLVRRRSFQEVLVQYLPGVMREKERPPIQKSRCSAAFSPVY